MDRQTNDVGAITIRSHSDNNDIDDEEDYDNDDVLWSFRRFIADRQGHDETMHSFCDDPSTDATERIP